MPATPQERRRRKTIKCLTNLSRLHDKKLKLLKTMALKRWHGTAHWMKLVQETNAAIRIQANFRRWHCQRLKKRLLGDADYQSQRRKSYIYAPRWRRTKLAAMKIQRCYRGFKFGRLVLKDLREQKEARLMFGRMIGRVRAKMRAL